MRFETMKEKCDYVWDNAIKMNEEEAVYECPHCGATYTNDWKAATCCDEQTEYDEEFDRKVDLAYDMWKEKEWGL